uniref:Uncharacterized protein n=1 Tax=viral metagenome TaxID=1070528 RepID=A0A6H1ZE44_9ZZZZ
MNCRTASTQDDCDPYKPYETWEQHMNNAADAMECRRPSEGGGNSEDCSCSPCRLAYWWDRLEPLERGILFAGMCEVGFSWTQGGNR